MLIMRRERESESCSCLNYEIWGGKKVRCFNINRQGRSVVTAVPLLGRLAKSRQEEREGQKRKCVITKRCCCLSFFCSFGWRGEQEGGVSRCHR